MKFFGALFIVCFAALNLKTVQVGARGYAYGRNHARALGIQPDLDQSQTQTADLDHYNVTLENNELLQDILSIINSRTSSCTSGSKSNPVDCSDILKSQPGSASGVYEIFPSRTESEKSIKVMCDMETDGGGWTAFLMRDNASRHLDFNRTWDTYKEFFGTADGEYWIGNENLHALTSNRNYSVRWEATDVLAERVWAEYNSFIVDSEANSYKLTLGGYINESTGVDTEGFYVNNGMKFSTIDSDNDLFSNSCAADYYGGWWYDKCTAIYATSPHDVIQGYLLLRQWSKADVNSKKLACFQMKIRPNP